MKLVQTKRDNLLKPLQAVTGIVEKRHTLPILSNVLIEQVDDRLHLLATDLEIQVSTSFGNAQKGADKYAVTASARKLQDILRALPEQADIGLEAQNNRLLVKSGKSRFTLQTLPAEDFPSCPKPRRRRSRSNCPRRPSSPCCCSCNSRWPSRTSAIT